VDLGATAAIFAAIVWLSVLPLMRDDPVEEAALSPAQAAFAAHADFPEVADMVYSTQLHVPRAEVFYPGIAAAPGGVMLDTDARDCHPCEGHLPSGGREPRHAAQQPLAELSTRRSAR
jgi:uncharacterized membrane protein